MLQEHNHNPLAFVHQFSWQELLQQRSKALHLYKQQHLLRQQLLRLYSPQVKQ